MSQLTKLVRHAVDTTLEFGASLWAQLPTSTSTNNNPNSHTLSWPCLTSSPRVEDSEWVKIENSKNDDYFRMTDANWCHREAAEGATGIPLPSERSRRIVSHRVNGTSSSCSTSTTAGRATSANSHERPALSEAEEREYRLNEKRARCILDSGFDELQFAVRAVEVRQVEDLERMEREREREPDGESDV